MEEMCCFSTVRRISNFTNWNRIFGGWRTGKKTQNIQTQTCFVMFFDFHRRRVTPPAAVGGLQRRAPGPREITHVVPEKAIFVEDFRVSGAPVGGGPVDASRGLYCVQCGIVISHAVWRLALLRMLRRVAAADFVGLRPFRRGSLQLAQSSCTHVSAVICGERLSCGRCADVRVSAPRASRNANSHCRIIVQNAGEGRNSVFSLKK